MELGNGSSFFVTKWHLHNPSRHRKEESKTKTEIQFRTTFSLMEKLEISLFSSSHVNFAVLRTFYKSNY